MAKIIKAERASKFQQNINIINNHFKNVGWKVQDDTVDRAIGALSPQSIVESYDIINEDLMPYLSAFHTSWLFKVCWAFPDCPEALDRPEDFDGTKILSKAGW